MDLHYFAELSQSQEQNSTDGPCAATRYRARIRFYDLGIQVPQVRGLRRHRLMARRKSILTGYDLQVDCHDHFEGSAHCIDCGGTCRLEGLALAYTALVRSLFESCEHIPYRALAQLRTAGVRVDEFLKRAAATRPY